MLQPGMCSASWSESRTWVGPPGAFATRSRPGRRPAGARFGPADAGVVAGARRHARGSAASRGSGQASSSSEGDDLARGRLEPGVARAAESPRFSVRISRTSYSARDRRGARRSSRRRRRSPRSPGSRARRAPRGSVPIVALAVVACRRRPRRAASPCSSGEGHVRERRARPRRAPASAAARGRRARSPSRRRRAPPRCHSSVQAKTNAPAQPAANAARICRSSSRAWTSTPWLRLSRPISVDQQRPLAGDVVEAREVGLERLLGLEVDVEADEVEERQLQVLGRGVVDVGDERVRGPPPSHASIEPLDEALDPVGCRASGRSRPGSRCRPRNREPRDGRRTSRAVSLDLRDRSRFALVLSSRNATCCSQARPTITVRPCSCARSSSQRGGTV